MNIMAIDPGNELSAYVVMDTDTKDLIEFDKVENRALLLSIIVGWCGVNYLAIEMPASYGMVVGKTVFDTCRWVGIFQQVFGLDQSSLVYRKSQNKAEGIDSVCMYLCKNPRAKDKNVRQSLIDLYPATGGGKTPQIGTKKQPGPLYGVSADVWSALAVAHTYAGSLG